MNAEKDELKSHVNARVSPTEKYYLSTIKQKDSDANELIKHLSNPAVRGNLNDIPDPYLYSDAMWWIDSLSNEAEEHLRQGHLRLYIRDKQTDKMVGNISLWKELNEAVWMLGYWLAEEYWGQGIMTWACTEILKRGQAEGITKVVVGRVKEGNTASRRVLEKNNFKKVKTNNDIPTQGGLSNEWEYEIDLGI
jgi:RimJ/RimL family protein N-acetyltransferase